MKIYFYLLHLVVSLGFASLTFAQQADQNAPISASSSEPRNVPDPRQAAMAELAKSQSPDTEVIWLETQLESFLGLYHPANSAQPKGAALILPHDRTSPDWPEMIHQIRTKLPDQDWHTLAIAMPEEPQTKAPLRAEKNNPPDNSPSNSSATAEPNSFAEKVFERIDAGLNHLQAENPKHVLVIGVGSSAYWASRYLSRKTQARNMLLVLIDAKPPLNNEQPTLAEAVAKIAIPTADIIHKSLPDKLLMEDLARKRKNQAKRDGRRFYLQRFIPGRPTANADNNTAIINQLRGLLKERMINMSKQLSMFKGKTEQQKPPGE